MSAEVRAIREDEREECLRLWQTVWPQDGSGYFERYFYGDVEWLPYYTQVAVVDGRLVSAVQICKRTVACGEMRLTMGGIANVATLPDYRGQGLNTRCLRAAIQVMEADAMDFSLLFTGINGYYAREGFSTLPHSRVFGRICADFTPHATPYTVRAATAEDLPAIRAVYDVYNRQRPIAVQRYEAYWREWMRVTPARLSAAWLVAVNSAGAVSGYVNYGISASNTPENDGANIAHIGEFGIDVTRSADGDETLLTAALLETVAQQCLAKGGGSLWLNMPMEPAVRAVVNELLPAPQQEENRGGMLRLLHRENLLRAVALDRNERWIAADRPRGMAVFSTPYGPVRLDATGDFLRVAPTDDTTDVLPQETLFALIFGNASPETVTGDPALQALFAAIFPQRATIYWGADGF